MSWAKCGSVHGFTGAIIGVDAGDTLVAEVEGSRHTIRLYGIDAPERGQHGANAAKRYLRSLALSHPVDVTVIETDVFGRDVAVVSRIGKESSINAAVVASGYAWVNPNACRLELCGQWQTLQQQARKYRLGIWSGIDPVPPWEFRIQRDP